MAEVRQILLQRLDHIILRRALTVEDPVQIGEYRLHLRNRTSLGVLDYPKIDECRLVLLVCRRVELLERLLPVGITPEEFARIAGIG